MPSTLFCILNYMYISAVFPLYPPFASQTSYFLPLSCFFLPTFPPFIPTSLPWSLLPSFLPSLPLSVLPSFPPSLSPSFLPSLPLSVLPSFPPSLSPSFPPSLPPSLRPSFLPSLPLSVLPSFLPTIPPFPSLFLLLQSHKSLESNLEGLSGILSNEMTTSSSFKDKILRTICYWLEISLLSFLPLLLLCCLLWWYSYLPCTCIRPFPSLLLLLLLLYTKQCD